MSACTSMALSRLTKPLDLGLSMSNAFANPPNS
jgi:hypothetical protein